MTPLERVHDLYLAAIGCLYPDHFSAEDVACLERVRLELASRLPPQQEPCLDDEDLFVAVAAIADPTLSRTALVAHLRQDLDELRSQGFVEGTPEARCKDLFIKRSRGGGLTADEAEELSRLIPQCPWVMAA
jgi:hypothetical protein